LRGLGAVLSDISNSNPYMKLLFDEWCISIYGDKIDNAFVPNKKISKKALSLCFVKWKIFRLKYEFFFDCLYLAEVYNENLLTTLYEYLKDKVANIYTRRILKRVYFYYTEGTSCNKIPEVQLQQRKTNKDFENLALKKILVVANVSAGKSTLINAIVGHNLNKTATNACTEKLCYIYNKPHEDGLIIKNRKTGQYVYDTNIERYVSDEAESVGLFFESTQLKGKKICLIDTPGFNDARNPERRSITEKAIRGNNYDALIYVANAAYMGRDDEQLLLKTIVKNTERPIIFVMNSLDKFKPAEDSIKDSIKHYHDDIQKLGLRKPMIVPLSARIALLKKLETQNLLDEEEMFELEKGKIKFLKEYYDLPKYVQSSQIPFSGKLIGRTGMSFLEKIISEI
jgi:small GTP-binding protein